jgi:hypothetical protein
MSPTTLPVVDHTTGVTGADYKYRIHPTPAIPRQRGPESLPENSVPLASLNKHSEAWRIALQSVQPTQGDRLQSMQQWAQGWAIALSLSTARALLTLVCRHLVPPVLLGSVPLSIHHLDTRGPVVELRIRAAIQQQRDSDRQRLATASATSVPVNDSSDLL